MAFIGHPILGDIKYRHQRRDGVAAQLITANELQHLLQLPEEAEAEFQAGAGEVSGSVEAAAAAPCTAAGAASARERGATTVGDGGDAAGPVTDAASDEMGELQQTGRRGVALAARGTGHAGSSAGAAERAHMLQLVQKGGGGGDGGTDADIGSDGSSAEEQDAEADADGGDVSGSGAEQRRRRQRELLSDGSEPPMCLWAVQLVLRHPESRELLDISIDTPNTLFAGICAAEEAVVARESQSGIS